MTYRLDEATRIAADRLIKPAEGCYRPRADGMFTSYADPASPLGKALRAAGLWSKYLANKAQPTAGMAALSGTPWTIGYGITGPSITKDTVWTAEQVEQSVLQEVRKRVEEVARKATPGSLTNGRLAALASMLYNVGPGKAGVKDGLFQLRNLPRASALWINHQAGRYDAAAAEFGNWIKAGGEVLPGLVTRRRNESAAYSGAAS